MKLSIFLSSNAVFSIKYPVYASIQRVTVFDNLLINGDTLTLSHPISNTKLIEVSETALGPVKEEVLPL
jgi:hypothetical protein